MLHTQVAAEQRINAYPYGSFLTPFSAADEVAAKPELTPGLQCLGLVPSTEVRREWLIGATQVMVAEPDNPRAQVALSAFVKGLHEEGRVLQIEARALDAHVRVGPLVRGSALP